MFETCIVIGVTALLGGTAVTGITIAVKDYVRVAWTNRQLKKKGGVTSK